MKYFSWLSVRNLICFFLSRTTVTNFFSHHFCLLLFRWRVRPQENTSNLHPIPDPWVGEGVSFQQIPNSKETDRNRTHSRSDWETDQDLVPKPKDEGKEGDKTRRRRPKYESRDEWRQNVGRHDVNERKCKWKLRCKLCLRDTLLFYLFLSFRHPCLALHLLHTQD